MNDDSGKTGNSGTKTQQWLWFVGLWIASVVALGAVSLLLRWLLLS
jgi:hypothetical protein